ncbi:hypothetical protein SDC9_189945 [bioreactor metagenome]|uniref:Uncharacterized protein n=1 Tax=bioreactor metagenome TaxID=1076179 RepID=A0A645HTL5_9ZZZZ
MLAHAEGFGSLVHFGHESPEQGDDGQTRCGNGESFGDRLHCIAGAIQRVGHIEGFFPERCHLHQATGVVDDRTVGIV